MRCELVIGRLIAHRCGRTAVQPCTRCQSQACALHFDTEVNLCVICAGTQEAATAVMSLEDFGDPLEFAPEIYGAIARRPGAPPDELTGIDS